MRHSHTYSDGARFARSRLRFTTGAYSAVFPAGVSEVVAVVGALTELARMSAQWRIPLSRVVQAVEVRAPVLPGRSFCPVERLLL